MMHIQTFYFNPFRECTYLLSDDKGKTIIIDCGAYTTAEQHRLQEYITKQGLTIEAHLLTHAHLDHCFGSKFLYDTYGILPQLSPADDYLFSHLQEQSIAFGCPIEETPMSLYQPLGDIMQIGVFNINVLPTPGHTPGGVCFYLKQESSTNQAPILFSGDTLFQGGIGRTDLPGGDYTTLLRSIREQIMPLPDNTIVYPGHSYATTLQEEKQNNPYL